MSIKEYELYKIANIINGRDLHAKIPLGNILTNRPTKHIYVKTSCFFNGYQKKPNFYVKNEYIDNDDVPKLICNAGDLVISKACNVGEASFIVFNNTAIYRALTKIEPNENIILKKYLFYWFKKNINNIKTLSNGTTIKTIDLDSLSRIVVSVPDVKYQQEIIDIIEPFERESEIIQSKINKLENIFNSLNRVAKKIGLMINNDVFFEKGISINSKYISNTKTDKAFLNVSAINNNINKWVINELPIENNIRFGDVLLSLDGTIGLVNNFLSGINGYGYKIYSNSISNSQIYLSLINNFNQKIMLDGSQGSVIKHASNTRNNLILFSYGDLDINNLYKYEISLKKQLMIVQEIIKKLINYHIK